MLRQDSPEEIQDWLVSLAGEQWSKAYHHGGAIWHRVLRSERFATLLDDHNPDCPCEDGYSRIVMWGGGVMSPIAEKYLLQGQYGMYEPSPYLDSLSSPA
jgi:hypothetical protein